MAATVWLGAWQLSRAAQKEALQAAIEERKSLAALDGRALAAIKIIANEMHRPVRLRGRWLPEHSVYLDNRQMQGKPGFYLVAPLALEDGGVVAVQRGWVPRDFAQRDRLPPVETPAGIVEVQGRIAPPPAKLYEFAGSPAGAIRQNLDLGEFSAQTRLPLRQDLSVQQTGAPSEGLLRDWPRAASGVEKHYGYAFQWFALAALIATLYVWFQFVAPRRKSRRA
ncbi:MAG: SURF1 family protein [Burkholderiales bacterium]|nr:SURF1 family protein [Burkholderiales bacterium]